MNAKLSKIHKRIRPAGRQKSGGNEKGKAIEALPFIELCLAVRLGLSSAGAQLKLKYGRHRIFVFLLQVLTGFFQLFFLGSEVNRALGLKLLNEIFHL